MFYEPGKTDHGLPYDPFKACVIPRPIGWISTVSPPHASQPPIYNLAPYSQFNNLTFDPPYVMFSANQTIAATATPTDGFNRKDTVHNAESTGYFCWQLATYPLREAVNASAESVPYGVDEFDRAGLEKEWSRCLPVKIPLVKDSPVKFECQLHTTLRLPANPPWGTVDIVIGRVIGVHINDRYLNADGKLDPALTQPIARCGYYDYAVVKETFEMRVPNTSVEQLAGLEGSVKGNRALREKLEGDTQGENGQTKEGETNGEVKT
ncbi:uncharacterized protein HMPREF1541_08058 [Cyphellophora europaea CBS 101466]|uniref:Flavin reductase like domain-containing protein n=1 Tax=Cyphellophora europaea (strain CBS 101466) TaxID=1220924 RepID=W2RMY9_CYPE1|nr:uncharacterized protein HMPREF1541_08058 [Cyphellophora europaea CBS 101466]ETN37068.1 hypothetical protein HMPREF1541_08058 [Cyphellophora europaea CBS 101466]